MTDANIAEVQIENAGRGIVWVAESLRKENMYLKQQNKAFEQKFQIFQGCYSNAEIVRLNSELGRLNEEIDKMTGHLRALTKSRDEAASSAKSYCKLLSKIRKTLGVEKDKEILRALAARKNSTLRTRIACSDRRIDDEDPMSGRTMTA